MATDLWTKALKGIQSRVPAATFETWFKPLKSLGRDGSTLRVKAPNAMFGEWIFSHYARAVQDALREAGGEGIEIAFVEEDGEAPQLVLTGPSPKRGKAAPQKRPQEMVGSFNPNYRFERFVVGPSNQFAHAAATAVAQDPCKIYNPLYIYGGVGLGKTHLIQSIGHYLREHSPSLKTGYLSTERFMNELISSIGNRTQMEFREKYRQLDVLLLDDIQFLAGKESTQEELFHTFNALHEAQKHVVISSDCHPRELQNIEERLRSRFEWGLIADIKPPDLETKVAILYEKAKAYDAKIPDEVALYIAGKIKSNVRELEGCLLRLIAFSSFKGKPVTLELAQETFHSLFKDDGSAATVEAIQKHVAAYYKMKVSELKSKTNKASVVTPRQVAMYLCKELTSASLLEMGEKFGGKHHSTVLHSIRKVEQKMKEDAAFQQHVHSFLRSFR